MTEVDNLVELWMESGLLKDLPKNKWKLAAHSFEQAKKRTLQTHIEIFCDESLVLPCIRKVLEPEDIIRFDIDNFLIEISKLYEYFYDSGFFDGGIDFSDFNYNGVTITLDMIDKINREILIIREKNDFDQKEDFEFENTDNDYDDSDNGEIWAVFCIIFSEIYIKKCRLVHNN